MLAELIVIVVILATVAFMYFKGSAIKSFLLFMNASISSAVAFAFFETAGRIIISYGFGGEWVFAGSFILIFVIIFVLLNILAGKLMSADIYFNDLLSDAID